MSHLTVDKSGLEVADVRPDGAVMYQLSSEQDVPGQPTGGGLHRAIRVDPGGTLAPGGDLTISKVEPLCSSRTGAQDGVRPEQM